MTKEILKGRKKERTKEKERMNETKNKEGQRFISYAFNSVPHYSF
jgi:hypothetical protein